VSEERAKVLIVAHDPSIRGTLSKTCAKLGLEVEMAKDGLRAILRAKRNPPQLLILEHRPPDTDAFNVCEHLLEPMRHGPEVIILTERRDLEAANRCGSLGVHCVPKGPETWTRLRPIFVDALGIGRDAVASLRPPRGHQTDPLSDDRARNRVLIVDDDLDLAKALARRLEKCGAVTFTAPDGLAGYRLALKERPDVIISDNVMANGSGHYMNWRLKSTEATKHIPVIVITGHRMDEDGYDPEKLDAPDHPGPVRYFHKPLDLDALLTETSHHCAIHYTPFDALHSAPS